MLFTALFITLALIAMSGVAVLNALTFPRLRLAPPRAAPSVSVLIPARNEAGRIARTVRALLAQPEVSEVLVLDDASTDGTGEAARTAAPGDGRLRVLNGAPLPAGWLGKNWACHQLAQAGRGDVLIFTDADVEWRPGALAAALGEFARTRADLLTLWPTQLTSTWGERLVVPLIALTIIGYLPVLATHHLPWRVFAAAMGQCLLFRRSAYARVGGHAAVRDHIVEDMALAKNIKSAGLRLRAADGAGLIACRMYQNWSEVRAGFGKNILAGHDGSPALLLLSGCLHWMCFVLPWLWAAGVGRWELGWAWPLSLVAMGIGVRALSAAVTRQRVADSLLMPLSVVLMSIIAVQALVWHWTGGPVWKGRPQRAAGAKTS
jgi:chlorobactene glucosyltransferase